MNAVTDSAGADMGLLDRFPIFFEVILRRSDLGSGRDRCRPSSEKKIFFDKLDDLLMPPISCCRNDDVARRVPFPDILQEILPCKGRHIFCGPQHRKPKRVTRIDVRLKIIMDEIVGIILCVLNLFEDDLDRKSVV